MTMTNPSLYVFSLLRAAGQPGAISALDETERERAESYRFDDDRSRFVGGRLGVRQVFASRLGVEADRLCFKEERGHPPAVTLDGAPLPFAWSFSRSGDLGALVIVDEGPVGVDIENFRPIPEALSVADLDFSNAERAVLQGLEGEALDRMFLVLWTAKEALVKANGEGLSAPLRDFTVAATPEGGRRLVEGKSPYAPDDWVLYAIGNGITVFGTLAVKAGSPPPELCDFPF